MKKYAFWIVLTLVILGVAWYWWTNKPKGDNTKTDETKDTDKPNISTIKTPTGGTPKMGNYLDNCGGLDAVLKQFAEDTHFRNQWLGPKFKCQTALAQYILNQKEKAGLVVDGDFGPATKAAVKKAFGKEQINLTEIDAKYKLTKIATEYKIGDISNMFSQ